MLRNGLRQACRWRLLDYDLTHAVEPPRPTKYRAHKLNSAEARKILDAFGGRALHAIVALAIGGGLRRGEVLGLKWSEVDLDAAEARIERQLIRHRGSGAFAPPKTDRSRRTVALPTWCIAILREHRHRQLEAQMRARDKWEDNDLVFTNAAGGAANPGEVSYEFAKGLRRAGLPHVRFHDLRHDFASLLLSDGEDLGVISDMMGHSTIAITKDLYAEASREAKRRAVARLDTILGS